MDNKVREFITSNAFTAFLIYVLPAKFIKSVPILRKLSFDQPDEYLEKLGWPSGSSLVNNFMLMMVLLVFGIAHLILYFVRNKQHRCSSLIMKIYKSFTLTIYIRFSIEVYMFIAIVTVSEFKYYAKNGGGDAFGHKSSGEDKQVKGNYVSIIFSCLIMICLLFFLLLAFVSWSRNKNRIFVDKCKTRELYHGVCKLQKGCINHKKKGMNSDINKELENEKEQQMEDQPDNEAKSDEVQNNSEQKLQNEEDQELIETSEVLHEIKVARLYS